MAAEITHFEQALANHTVRTLPGFDPFHREASHIDGPYDQYWEVEQSVFDNCTTTDGDSLLQAIHKVCTPVSTRRSENSVQVSWPDGLNSV